MDSFDLFNILIFFKMAVNSLAEVKIGLSSLSGFIIWILKNQ